MTNHMKAKDKEQHQKQSSSQILLHGLGRESSQVDNIKIIDEGTRACTTIVMHVDQTMSKNHISMNNDIHDNSEKIEEIKASNFQTGNIALD